MENQIRFVVVGAGAIGAFIGAALARGGSEVVLVARGPHLAALRRDGLRIESQGQEFHDRLPATDDLSVVKDADIVLLTVKAYSVAAIAEQLAPWLDGGTSVVAAQNGIPWWYFHAQPGPFADRVIRSVDPDGTISESIAPEQVIGCAMYCSAEIIAPGVIRHIEGTKFVIGEPSGVMSDRCRSIATALVDGGLKSTVTPDIRTQIWLKVVGNVAFNPVSALTGSTLGEMGESASLRAVLRAVMEEAAAVAAELGITLPVSIERRLEGGFAVGAHKTSMLQDLEAGKPLELDCLTGAVVELAELVGVPVPHLHTIHACTEMRRRSPTWTTSKIL